MTDAHVTPSAISVVSAVGSTSVKTGSRAVPNSIAAVISVASPAYISGSSAAVGYFTDYSGQWILYSWLDANYYLYLAAFDANPTAAYSVSPIAISPSLAYSVNSGQLILTEDVVFAALGASHTITYMGVVESQTGTNLLFYFPLDDAITWTAGNTLTVAAGTFSLYAPVGA